MLPLIFRLLRALIFYYGKIPVHASDFHLHGNILIKCVTIMEINNNYVKDYNMLNHAIKSIFVDESGNYGFDFDKPNVSSHYIVAAVIVDSEKESSLRKSVNEIRKKYFQTGEMKSSIIKNRRFHLLSDLAKLDFQIIAVIADKRNIPSGTPIHEFKKTFFKFINRLLYEEMNILNCNLAICADEHGSEEFMQSFRKYIEKRLPNTLIDGHSFEFVNSKYDILIQLADIIAGTLSFGYEVNKKSNEYNGYYGLLKDKIIGLKPWPSINVDDLLSSIDCSKYNKVIAENCITNASNYIKKYEFSKEEHNIDQVKILRYLLNEIYVGNANKYFYSAVLIKYLLNSTGRAYTRHTFHSQIIAPLRDGGVIISSNARGLKIPVALDEIFSYTEKTLGQVKPMLDRLENARKRVKAVTNNEIDIVGSDKYKRIREYMDNVT